MLTSRLDKTLKSHSMSVPKPETYAAAPVPDSTYKKKLLIKLPLKSHFYCPASSWQTLPATSMPRKAKSNLGKASNRYNSRRQAKGKGQGVGSGIPAGSRVNAIIREPTPSGKLRIKQYQYQYQRAYVPRPQDTSKLHWRSDSQEWVDCAES